MSADDRVIRNVRRLAKARKVSLTKLCDLADVGRGHFWRVLGGEASPTVAWCERIADALDVDVADLLAK